MQLDGIDGRVALVTGGARGIGRCIAETLRDLGARVAAGDLQAPDLAGVLGVELDVTAERSVDTAFATIERELGAVDLLVCNAGILVRGYLEETTLDDWRRSLDVNVTGAFLCARRAAGAMRERGYGRIVMIGSSAGHNGVGAAPPPLHAYAASKAAIMTLAKSIALEYASHGVTANAIAPSARTRMTEAVFAEMMAPVEDGFDAMAPENIAPLVVWLGSNESADVTGRVFEVEGGRISVADGWQHGNAIDLGRRWQPAEVGSPVRELLAKAPPPAPVYGGV
jgi:NAD(P)-dependent dehydrogenase (short-subunit alcohol dehydrogenase family)